MKVTVIGASGFVGRHLCEALRSRGDNVTTASLRDVPAAARTCDGADCVVNLSGEPVAERWTTQNKAKIRESRVEQPRALIASFASLAQAPKAYVSASAVGYYGTSETATFDESAPPGDDFLASVCVAWEAEAHRAAEHGARVAIVRTGIALGTDGGALAKLLPIFRKGAGGPVASGQQWYSWIHIADVIGIYLAAIDGLEGALNASAPEPVRNAEFTRILGEALHRPAIVPVPVFALKLMLGEAASIVTQGQRVLPERTQRLGYGFRFPLLAPALADLLQTV